MVRRKHAYTAPPDWEARGDISKFKLAEKRYKRYAGRTTDFSAVLHPQLQGNSRLRFRPLAKAKDDDTLATSCTALEIEGRDGLIILPRFISCEEQVMSSSLDEEDKMW